MEIYFRSVLAAQEQMGELTAINTLNRLSAMLHAHFGRQVIILLDEYDAPMQEAYVPATGMRL